MKAQRILESVREFSNIADYEINTQRSITLIHIYMCVCVCVLNIWNNLTI